MLSPNKRLIFLVVSHLENLSDVTYELSQDENKFKLIEELCEIKRIEENVTFKVRVLSISFEESEINNSESELEINLNKGQNETFKGTINFSLNKDNFIYDFSFDILYKEKKI